MTDPGFTDDPRRRRVTEQRLGAVLAREDHAAGLGEADPVFALVVEGMAASHPEHADGVREVGGFLCDLLGAVEGNDAPRLTLAVVAHTYAREEYTDVAVMRAYLGSTAERDLLLGLAVQALLATPVDRGSSSVSPESRDVVVRTLYLLLRMHEAQEEADALQRAVRI